MHPIQLIVGLKNPGASYAATRHNAGEWFVNAVAQAYNTTLKAEPKLLGDVGHFELHKHKCRLFLPHTYMNHSGEALAAIIQFYKIPPQNILIVHDELDLPCGIIRLKYDGGHGGHNGLRSIIQYVHTHAFYRLRIGIGRPDPKQDVVNYVLTKPRGEELKLIEDQIHSALGIIPLLLEGEVQKAMQQLHT